MKVKLLKTTAVLAIPLLLLIAGGGGAQTPEKARTVETVIEYQNYALQVGMEAVVNLLKTTKTDKSATVDVWNELNEKYFTSYARIGHYEFDSLLKQEKNEAVAARAADWDQAVRLFTGELQNVGEVVLWLRELNRDIMSMEYDTLHSGERLKHFMKWPAEDGPGAAKISSELKTGKLSSKEVKKYLEDVQRMKSRAENVSSSITNEVEELEKSVVTGKAMDGRIVKILEAWGDTASRHPAMGAEKAEIAAGWVPVVKKRFEDFSKVREEFNKAFGPLLEGKLFRDVPLYRDYGYGELAKPFHDLELELKTALVAAAQKEKSEAELREAIAKDEELTKKEREQVWKLWNSVTEEKRRQLTLELVRAGGGKERRTELTLRMVKLPEESEEYKKLREELTLLEEERHPEQLAVKKKIQEFEELKKKVEEEVRKILLEHEKRRRSLGLEPGIFGP
ncbi:MAG: hypothetical protein ACOX5A_01615 [Aminivibrio sp.]|jgi:hypothetical protein